MLPSTPHVESVYLDEKTGLLSGIASVGDNESHLVPDTTEEPTAHPEVQPHTLLIDQTTLDPTAAMAVAAKVQSGTGGRAVMLDAPVSGGKLSSSYWLLLMLSRYCSGYCRELDDHVRLAFERGE